MLILTRKPEQSIIIDNDIRVTVLAVDGDRVKIGIHAPANVAIVREEVQQAVGGENRRALTSARNRTALESALQQLRKKEDA
jgi:carbon storage regulator